MTKSERKRAVARAKRRSRKIIETTVEKCRAAGIPEQVIRDVAKAHEDAWDLPGTDHSEALSVYAGEMLLAFMEWLDDPRDPEPIAPWQHPVLLTRMIVNMTRASFINDRL